MSLLKRYLIQAVYDWTLDNGFTPHVLVDATEEGVRVPGQYVQEGRIVLNIHPRSVRDYELGDDWLHVSARFSGREFRVEVPLPAIRAIYAKENGQGMSFPETAEEPDATGESKAAAKAGSGRKKPPGLRVVK